MLEPYMYMLPEKYVKLRPLFELLGCHHQITFQCLLKIQKDIQTKYDSEDDPVCAKRDKAIIMNIVQELAFELKTEEDDMSNLLLPVISNNSAQVRLVPVGECVYTTDNFFLDDVNHGTLDFAIMDRKIGIEIAEKLGVQSLTSRIMKENGAEEIQDWGQSEPITTRIQRLLDEYRDCFSVPKELVQNADDAGATKLCFLYDERDNMDFQTGLIDHGMAECQGPALWVYNDATFSEQDFRNIIKLAGKTKEEDVLTIGKFGLGFCSVYNITDVPSFISGNSLVIFDPHTSHLGQAIRNKNSPGIRINFTERSLHFLQRFKNQFMPFNGIFGCNLTGNETPGFKGTLFRFPLRTKQQANNGKIVDQPYKRKDMIALLKQFAENAGNLLLFTQNVNEITIQYLPADESVCGIVDIFSTCRENQEGQGDLNFLRKISNVQSTNTEDIRTTYEVSIRLTNTSNGSDLLGLEKDDSVSRWLISWASGTNESTSKAKSLKRKGVVPLGSVAMPRDFSLTESLGPVPRGFYKVSHVFCFLPLPVEVSLPVHINGAFFVDKSRRALAQKGTDTISPNEECEWNDALLGDAVCLSYLELLDKLPVCLVDKGSCAEFTNFWPRFNDNELKPLVQGFYNKMADSTHALFEKNGEKFKFNDCIFLHHELRYHEHLGDIASDTFETFFKIQEKVTMQIPETIYNQFKIADIEGCMHEITCDRFFIDAFLPNLKDQIWKDNETKRNSLLIFALEYAEKQSDSTTGAELLEALKETECIPTRPRGRLVKPWNLVEEMSDSPILGMFSEDDERFIQSEKEGRYLDHNILCTLRKLGMMTQKIPDSIVLERARSVQCLPHRHQQLRRSHALANYLNSLEEENLKFLCKPLSDVPWIPVLLQCPRDYPFSWYTSKNGLCKQDEAYNSQYQFLCGSVANIQENFVDEVLLKMYNTRNPSVDVVLQQLNTVVEEMGRNRDSTSV